MSASSIEWTEHTWNPTTGCTKASPGCKNCYASGMARRLQAMGAPGYDKGFELDAGAMLHRDGPGQACSYCGFPPEMGLKPSDAHPLVR